MNHKHFLKLAKQASQKSTYSAHRRVQIGCIAVYKGTVLAKGWNTDRTHPSQRRFNVYRYDTDLINSPDKLHAELKVLQAIKYLDIDFSKVKLYVYREYNDGSPAMARPCRACFEAIHQQGINTIIYSTDDGYAIEKINQK